MTGLDLCQWIRETPLSIALSESTWGVPALGAIHVLGIAWFGGAVLLKDPRLAAYRRIGLAVMLTTGTLLFWSQPVHCYQSFSFRLKMALLALIAMHPALRRFVPGERTVALAMWAGVIAAARGIAFF